MGMCDYIVRGMVAESSLEMEDVTSLFCPKTPPEVDKYYIKRTTTLPVNDKLENYGYGAPSCNVGCRGSYNYVGNSSSIYIATPFVHDDGEIYVNKLIIENFNGSSNGNGANAGLLDPCGCATNSIYRQKVLSSYEEKWVLVNGVMTKTYPPDSNKITCKKLVKETNACGGESGYEYPGPEVQDDCLSDTWFAFDGFCPLCSPCLTNNCGTFVSDGPCYNQVLNRQCNDNKVELTKQNLFDLVSESTEKKILYKQNLPDTSPGKWTNIVEGCGGPILFQHQETPINYGATIQKLDLQIIHKSFLDPRAIPKIENRSGKLSFYDSETMMLLKQINFTLKNGKANLGIISNTDEELAPAGPGQTRSISIIIN